MNVSSLPSLQSLRTQTSAQSSIVIANTQPITDLLAGTNILSSSQVDSILIALDGNGLLNGTVDLSGQTPPAPPSAVGMARALSLIAKTWTVTLDPAIFIFDDGSGGFWQLIVDISGNVGTQATVGPATSDVILADGVGGFWKIVVDIAGNRGTTPDAGPATLVPALDDGTGVFWKLIVDATGNLGAQQIVPIAWAPVAETVTWIDTNGTFAGDLSTFRSTADFATVTSLVFGGTGNLTSLTGIQELPALATLDCNTNALTSLDCTNCTTLTTVNCSSNAALVTLTLTGCVALTMLDCNTCPITSLDVTTFPLIQSINIQDCSITNFNASGCASLNTLTGLDNSNPLIVADLSGCSSITTISVTGATGLTSLVLTGCTGLTTLDASGCALTSLDLHTCSSIQSIIITAATNTLTTLNVTGCANLTDLFCTGQQISSLSVLTCVSLVNLNCYSNINLTSLDVHGLTNLATLDCDSSPITSINVAGCTALSNFQCDGCLESSLDLHTCAALSTATLGSNLNLTNVNILGCTSLSNLNIAACSLTTGAGGSVNVILTNMVTNNPPVGSIIINNQTPAAAPDAGPPDGATAVTTLSGLGWSITTD